MRQPVVRRGDPGIAHIRGGTHHLDHFINNLCWGTFCRTEEWRQVEADAHDTLLEDFKPLTLPLARREGPPLMRRPSAVADAGNGAPLNWRPSADAVAGRGQRIKTAAAP